MSIEIGSKWVKDGEVVEVEAIFYYKTYEAIWFFAKGERHVLTNLDFLEQYKPYEPTYEYKYAFRKKAPYEDIRISIYKTESEITTWLNETDVSFEFQRLDFTKRERKQ